MSMTLRSLACLLVVLLCGNVCRADQKSDLYQKGQAAVNAGDPFAARDAFCALPQDYRDAAAQCATYAPLAEKALLRYKFNYADGVASLQNNDLDTAKKKFGNVKTGPYFEQAQQKLAEIKRMEAQREAELAGRNEVLTIVSTGKLFQSACGTNTEFEQVPLKTHAAILFLRGMDKRNHGPT